MRTMVFIVYVGRKYFYGRNPTKSHEKKLDRDLNRKSSSTWQQMT